MRTFTYVLVGLICALFIFPFYWMINSSLQGKEVLSEYPPSFVPRTSVKLDAPGAPLPVFKLFTSSGVELLAQVGASGGDLYFLRLDGDRLSESAYVEPKNGDRLRPTGETATFRDRKLTVVELKGEAGAGRAVDLGALIVSEGGGQVEEVLIWPVRDGQIETSALLVPRSELSTVKRFAPRWGNYGEALTRLPFVIFFRNSFLICGLSVVGQLLSSSLVAYGFARIHFRGRNVWFVILLATMMIPAQVTMIPMFIGFKAIGWIDSLLPLIVPQFFAGAFNVFLLRQFFLGIPRELDEAAEIDGCSSLGIWWRIILPLSKPALIVVGMFTFVWMWKDLLGPLIYIDSLDKRTVALGLEFFRNPHEVNEHLLMAASITSLVPVALLFFLVQKYIVGGIALTGLKR